MKLFPKKTFKPPFNTELPITFAFEVGGIKYYQFDDAFNTPCERALKALTYYEELRMRCTRDYLEKHCQAVKEVLSNTKIDVQRLAVLNQQLLDRLELIIEPDIAYKLASVVYFDKNESPYVFDDKYAAKKVEHWKKHKGVHDFFLQKPVQALIPFINGSEVNLDIYSEVVRNLNRIHSALISGEPSETKKPIPSGKD
jgi:hypothetical protein